jgi:hypothetical protein
LSELKEFFPQLHRNERMADQSIVWMVKQIATTNLGLVLYGVRTR